MALLCSRQMPNFEKLYGQATRMGVCNSTFPALASLPSWKFLKTAVATISAKGITMNTPWVRIAGCRRQRVEDTSATTKSLGCSKFAPILSLYIPIYPYILLIYPYIIPILPKILKTCWPCWFSKTPCKQTCLKRHTQMTTRFRPRCRTLQRRSRSFPISSAATRSRACKANSRIALQWKSVEVALMHLVASV